MASRNSDHVGAPPPSRGHTGDDKVIEEGSASNLAISSSTSLKDNIKDILRLIGGYPADNDPSFS